MFKVGDEVLVKGEITGTQSGSKYKFDVRLCGAAHLFFAEEEMIPVDKTYTQGLADAWELAKKIYDMNVFVVDEIFNVDSGFFSVISNLTCEEALAKIEAYEKEKEIKVGDVVESRDTKRKFLVVTEEDDDSVYEFGVIDLKTLTLDRICNYPKGFTKTGKHIDIESLLKEIGE